MENGSEKQKKSVRSRGRKRKFRAIQTAKSRELDSFHKNGYMKFKVPIETRASLDAAIKARMAEVSKWTSGNPSCDGNEVPNGNSQRHSENVVRTAE